MARIIRHGRSTLNFGLESGVSWSCYPQRDWCWSHWVSLLEENWCSLMHGSQEYDSRFFETTVACLRHILWSPGTSQIIVHQWHSTSIL